MLTEIKTPKSIMMLWCLTMSGLCFSQDKTIGSADQNQNPEHTLLWKVTGKNFTRPSYIFGTMHILCEEDAQLSENLKNIIKDTEQIFFEIDMDNTKEMMGAIKYLNMNEGKRISELLSTEEYEKVKKFFDENKVMIPFAMMDRFKPYFVSSLIGERMMACEKTNGMETQIMAEAEQYEKDILGLETIEFQAGIFDSIPYEKQAKDLVMYVDSIDSYKKVLTEMATVYRSQDLEKMEELMIKSDPGMEKYMDLLLYDRNKRWIDPMLSNMHDKSTLFAVGAGHLPGKEGVLNLLRARGYTVTPVKN